MDVYSRPKKRFGEKNLLDTSSMTRKRKVAHRYGGRQKPLGSKKKETNDKQQVTKDMWQLDQFEKLNSEEQEIVLDRVEMEIAKQLDVNATLKAAVVCGVNQVSRCIARSQASVVVFAVDPKAPTFTQIPMLCKLHHVSICVLTLSSKALGALFGMKSLSTFAIVNSQGQSDEMYTDNNAEGLNQDSNSDQATTNTEEQAKVDSIVHFLQSKSSQNVDADKSLE